MSGLALPAAALGVALAAQAPLPLSLELRGAMSRAAPATVLQVGVPLFSGARSYLWFDARLGLEQVAGECVVRISMTQAGPEGKPNPAMLVGVPVPGGEEEVRGPGQCSAQRDAVAGLIVKIAASARASAIGSDPKETPPVGVDEMLALKSSVAMEAEPQPAARAVEVGGQQPDKPVAKRPSRKAPVSKPRKVEEREYPLISEPPPIILPPDQPQAEATTP